MRHLFTYRFDTGAVDYCVVELVNDPVTSWSVARVFVFYRKTARWQYVSELTFIAKFGSDAQDIINNAYEEAATSELQT